MSAEHAKRLKMFINGEWIESSSGEELDVRNPATGKVIAKVPSASREDVNAAVDAAREAFDKGVWSQLPVGERSKILLKIAEIMEQYASELIEIETTNTGKTIRQATYYDIPYAIDNLRFYAGAARTLQGIATGEYVSDGTSTIRREPIGVVGVITPWNYPLVELVWQAFAALAVGNTVVVKPSSYTPLSTLKVAEIVEKAGVPKGVFNVVTGPGESVGEEIARNQKIDVLAFVGSTETGRRLYELAAPNVKRLSLELGGKAPFIVFEDANIDAAVEAALVGQLVNNGQDCANSTRYYIHESVLDQFIDKLKRRLSSVKVGNPLDYETDMGPLISESHRNRVERYIKRGIEEGGALIFGGDRPVIKGFEGGYFLNPTVIYTENEESSIVKEEIFGPVFTILKFSSYDEVIERANNVIYGLGASVWTKNVTTAMRAVKDLRFGTVWVNEHLVVPSETPWAGYRQSGNGVGLSVYALEQYTYIKHVYIDITGKTRKDWYYYIIKH